MNDLKALRFPVGEYVYPDKVDGIILSKWKEKINAFPNRVDALVRDLSDEELSWQYRPSGWSLQQLVHHCADSHMNAFIRFKITLTEDSPDIRPYFEDRWADMKETFDSPIGLSMEILKGVHGRWSILLDQMDDKDLERSYYHPEYKKPYTLEEALGSYAWHCDHHFAHMLNALNARGKYN